MNEQDILYHKVNPYCDCTMCFIKSVMDESKCSYKEVLEVLMAMQDKGLIKINKYDDEGHPTEIIRISLKKLKKYAKSLG